MDSSISNAEKGFVLEALRAGIRVDGRNLYDFRDLEIAFSLDDTAAEVCLGETRVLAVVKGDLVAPYPDRASEGSVQFHVDFNPMASPALESYDQARPVQSELSAQISRLVERSLKTARAIDLESLCILTGRKVWSLRVDIRVLDHGGNLFDACILAAVAALMSFRRPVVSVGAATSSGQTEIVVHPPDVKEPLPLNLHFLPIPTTVAVFGPATMDAGAAAGESTISTPQGGGDSPALVSQLLVDPSLREESTMDGALTIVMTSNEDVCMIHTSRGTVLSAGSTSSTAHDGGVTPPSSNQISQCLQLAAVKAKEVTLQLQAALEVHNKARVAARIRRHGGGTDLARGKKDGRSKDAGTGAPSPVYNILLMDEDDEVDDGGLTSSSEEEEKDDDDMRRKAEEEAMMVNEGSSHGVLDEDKKFLAVSLGMTTKQETKYSDIETNAHIDTRIDGNEEEENQAMMMSDADLVTRAVRGASGGLHSAVKQKKPRTKTSRKL